MPVTQAFAPARTVVVDVPVTLRIEMAVHGEPPSESSALARSIAYRAAEHFAHVSHAEIQAFNTVDGLRDENNAGSGATVSKVTSTLDGNGTHGF